MIRYPNCVGAESIALQADATVSRMAELGRSAAWLARQTELALATLDLSLPQYRVLGLLADHGAAVSSKLASDLVVRPPSVTAVIDGLVTRGCVTRQHGEDDRRRVSVELTPRGQLLLAEADAAVNGRLAEIAASLGDPELTSQAAEGLVLWRDAIRAYKSSGLGARSSGGSRDAR